jgi:hypothetical protein
VSTRAKSPSGVVASSVMRLNLAGA